MIKIQPLARFRLTDYYVFEDTRAKHLRNRLTGEKTDEKGETMLQFCIWTEK